MYLDTSVLVSLYAPEPDSARCEEVVTAAPGIVISELAVAELSGALLAKEKNGQLTSALRTSILDHFKSSIANHEIQVVPLDRHVIEDAVEIMQRVHPQVLLRTLDAIQLASYLSVDAGPLFTRDKRMQQAARMLGIALAD